VVPGSWRSGEIQTGERRSAQPHVRDHRGLYGSGRVARQVSASGRCQCDIGDWRLRQDRPAGLGHRHRVRPAEVMPTRDRPPDVIARDEGRTWRLSPRTNRAREWLEAHGKGMRDGGEWVVTHAEGDPTAGQAPEGGAPRPKSPLKCRRRSGSMTQANRCPPGPAPAVVSRCRSRATLAQSGAGARMVSRPLSSRHHLVWALRGTATEPVGLAGGARVG
jgi:hypothetical protein